MAAATARRVVLIGFGIGIVCSLIGTQIILNTGVAVPLRVAIGSAVAFITAQYLDIRIFDRLRNRAWWLAPFASSMLGSAFDTALFFTISFRRVYHLWHSRRWANKLGVDFCPRAGLGRNCPALDIARPC